MLRMTPLVSAIVALLLGIEAYAAEETFDTHFMIGGMKDQQVANIRLDEVPIHGQMALGEGTGAVLMVQLLKTAHFAFMNIGTMVELLEK